MAYVRDVRGATLCGIEITPEAEAVHTHPFRGTTAFLAGNEGQGLLPAHLDACDHCVYIPQVVAPASPTARRPRRSWIFESPPRSTRPRPRAST